MDTNGEPARAGRRSERATPYDVGAALRAGRELTGGSEPRFPISPRTFRLLWLTLGLLVGVSGAIAGAYACGCLGGVP